MSYTTGSRHDLVTETSASSHFGCEGKDFSADVANNTDPYIPADAMQFPSGELDLDHLLNLGGLVTSQDPLVSSIATRNAVSTISRFNQLLSPTVSTHSPMLLSKSGNQTIFSNVARALPPSSRTTLISKAARISKPGSRARTPVASSHSTSITSVLKSSCRTNQRPATEPNRNRLRVDRGCRLRGLRNSLGCGCVL